jgi:phosphate transport system permease protein
MTAAFDDNIESRKRKARNRAAIFMAATIISALFLFVLAASIVNQSFGYFLVRYETDPATLARNGVLLDNQDASQLVETLRDNLPRRQFSTLDLEAPLASRDRKELLALAYKEIVGEEPVRTWTLSQSILGSKGIREFRDASYPDGILVFRSWLNLQLLSNPQSSSAMSAGLRGAIIGSLATILLTLLFAFPVGVGAAIWLEEYAQDNRLNRFIRLNIYNLAGVPSIIYGMLGLAIFVRALEPLSSGAIFGLADSGGATGRTILSASLTLALLVLPVIIINAQEAIKAVPQSLRQAGLALGATKWRTIWSHVLPASADRILTGTVLAMSRALGETAPLVVVGASTFLTQDPTGLFSRFTTLPIQIYQWTARPQGEFKSLAAAAILVLLILLLGLNAAAVLMRNRYRKRRRTGL